MTSGVDFLPLIGKSLSVAERTALQCSLPLLEHRYSTPAEFWGKVCGVKRDYLVAQLAPKGFFGPRISLYSIDAGNTWQLLELPTEAQRELCDGLRGLFIGDPHYVYKVRRDLPPDPQPAATPLPEAPDELRAAQAALTEAAAKESDEAGAATGHGDDDENEGEDDEEELDEANEEDEEGDEEAPQVVPAPKMKKPKYMVLTVPERCRLMHFIALHDEACRLVLRGEYVRHGAPEPERNRCFTGQPVHHAMKPSCYCKSAHCGTPARLRALYGPTYNPHTDWLQPITEDAPRGVWTVKYDPTLNVVTVQNLLYPGSLFWYQPDTLRRGQVYYGDGERNLELYFTL